jgi:hypothetical protein
MAYEREFHKKKLILLFIIPSILVKSKNNNLYKMCDYKNCIFTRDRKKVLDANAIIFYVGFRNERMGIEPPVNNSVRNPNQVWIFTATEPP